MWRSLVGIDFTARLAKEREAEVLVTLNVYAVEGAAADVRRIEAELQQARTAVPEKEAILRAAEADLDRTIIRSPIDGVVVGRFINEGQTLAVGLEARTNFPVAHRLEDMEIHAQVDEADIGSRSIPIRIGASKPWCGKSARHQRRSNTWSPRPSCCRPPISTAHSSRYDGAAQDRDRPPGRCFEGAVAALRFQPSGTQPSEAQGRDGVWLRTPTGSLKRVAVTVGAAGAEQVALKSGDLTEGSQVAVGQAIRSGGMELLGIRFGS
ncbi:hypothetical protein [Bradyrhizobium arachidis]|uniref:hypothetical protein n=1 Tax=Bradyrhizobium arachidis TaxID=858423 RepID=UPI0021623692|nr:hypothetical protein [Bradyrhizobium arachidis]